MSDPDDAKDEQDTNAESAESAEAAPRKERSSASGKARRKQGASKAPPPSSVGSRVLLVAAIALAAGVAGGWFGRDAQAKAKLRADSAPATADSAQSGPCGAWQRKICASSGDQSAACHQAKGAAELLTSGTCEQALETVPATLAKLKAARVPCDNLVSKLCADLPPGSQACGLVKEKTPSFPADKCQEMLQNYDAVIGELKTLDQQMGQAPPMGGGMPPGMGPHGMPQGMPPQGMPPQGEPQ